MVIGNGKGSGQTEAESEIRQVIIKEKDKFLRSSYIHYIVAYGNLGLINKFQSLSIYYLCEVTLE